jgi:hypothetical protein
MAPGQSLARARKAVPDAVARKELTAMQGAADVPSPVGLCLRQPRHQHGEARRGVVPATAAVVPGPLGCWDRRPMRIGPPTL